ncbi:MAG TPA: glycosyltransferase [Actinocrinis sp.]|uniref:glycosyltransferase n=1 Tax=Actinocrinis sp. TaxID=1920516 RepID=UPI002DDD9C63|nr:glycosyltransferase [Actinocrinis sp.]HEV2348073.1 glycosyltransferase [Actinocrinis sp.]
MRIASIAFGSRGDVQPALALGMGLQDRGHQVRMVVGADFPEEARKCGLEASAATVDFQEMLSSELGRKMFDAGNGATLLTFIRTMKRIFELNGPALMDGVYRACTEFGAEAVIGSYTSDFYAMAVAEKLGIPYISTTLQPAPLATRSGSAALSTLMPHRESLVNLAFHKAMVEPFVWRIMKDPVNRFRRDVLGLPARRNRDVQQAMRRTPILNGYSRHLVPQPADWPATVHTTGFWLLESDLGFAAPSELLKFLDDGEPPVFISFGSTTTQDSAALTRLLVDAVAISGRRAIIQSGWANLGDTDLPDHIHRLTSYVPYRELFGHVAAVVHHSGAGTTSWVLHAGVPSVAIPHAGDQPFWAARAAALGAGPRPVPAGKLTADNLAQAIRRATGDSSMRERAAELGVKIRAEDGIGTAVELIEKYLSQM